MAEIEEKTVRIRVNEDVFTVRPEDVTRNVALECMQDTGLSFEQAIAGMFLQPGKTALSAFIWLARRQAGAPRMIREGRVTRRLIDDVWEALRPYDDDIDLFVEDDVEVAAPDPGT